jgi:hypothetical protein
MREGKNGTRSTNELAIHHRSSTVIESSLVGQKNGPSTIPLAKVFFGSAGLFRAVPFGWRIFLSSSGLQKDNSSEKAGDGLGRAWGGEQEKPSAE